jgi:hypothetical protein
MKKNIGTADRAFRTIIAFIIGILIVTGTLTGLTAVILGSIAVILLLTSMVSICPLYLALHISTARKQ